MDRREAIEWLKSIRMTSVFEQAEALDLAIEALGQTEIVRCKDCKHRDLFSCPLVDNDFQKDEDFCSWGEAEKHQQSGETSTNTSTNTSTCNQTCNKKQVTSKLKNPCDSLLKADSDECNEQKSKLDCISRQQAIEALTGWETEPLDEDIVMALENLPTIEVSEDVEDMGEVSDGYHTFNQLYHQRAVLFATIVNQNKDKAWKSWKHEDGKFCFDKGGEWFIVGVDTPEENYTYHYEKKYWDMFDCEELERAKHWDGHTEEDVTRLLSLPPVTPTKEPICTHFYKGYCSRFEDGCFWQCQTERTGEWIGREHCQVDEDAYDVAICSNCGAEITLEYTNDNFCPNCGAKMKGGDTE